MTAFGHWQITAGMADMRRKASGQYTLSSLKSYVGWNISLSRAIGGWCTTARKAPIVLLGCDAGARHKSTFCDTDWCRTQGLTAGGWRSFLRRLGTGNVPAAY